jgi:hypothetical protein
MDQKVLWKEIRIVLDVYQIKFHLKKLDLALGGRVGEDSEGEASLK